jgi:hypothetical protein
MSNRLNEILEEIRELENRVQAEMMCREEDCSRLTGCISRNLI